MLLGMGIKRNVINFAPSFHAKRKVRRRTIPRLFPASLRYFSVIIMLAKNIKAVPVVLDGTPAR